MSLKEGEVVTGKTLGPDGSVVDGSISGPKIVRATVYDDPPEVVIDTLRRGDPKIRISLEEYESWPVIEPNK